MPESPKFLVQRRFREEAIKSLEYINKFKSKFNKVNKYFANIDKIGYFQNIYL